MKVLIAIDGLSFSEAVVQAVAQRPWPRGTTVHVISVVDPFVTADVQALIFEGTRAAQVTVEKAAAQLHAAGFTVSAEALEGHPATTIVAEAREIGADFVFVGSHGSRAIARFLLGSTALAVVRNGPCSVEVVRMGRKNHSGDAAKGTRILLATDGSEYSALAAKSIAGRPWPAGTEVRIVCASECYAPWVDVPTSNLDVWEDLRKAYIDQAGEAVVAAETILAKARLKTQSFVPSIFAAAKAVILDESIGWNADLIVVGSHGRRGLDHFLLGSVSEAIAMSAQCSVDVIRPRKID